MYVRRNINVRHLLNDSWVFLIIVGLWSVLIVYLNEFLKLRFIAIPIAPVTTIGIAVSLYLGFKSTSAYNRWWEARQIWGDVINRSRDWGNCVFNMIYKEGAQADPAIQTELIERQIAWVNALAYQLRGRSRLKETGVTRFFGHRRMFTDAHFHQTQESYRRHLSAEEASQLEKYANVATHLVRRQGDRLRELAQDGFLDSHRLGSMMAILGALYDAQGKCERIKNTPFPRQVANFGLMFTWVFIFLLPLAFVEIFEAEVELHHMSEFLSHEFMLVMVPFTVLISWVFFIMEKVSDSTEDPFEGGVTDVPISALCRTIEIDLKQMMDAQDVPEPLKPIDGVLY
jgi:ion channel-forming bestrophin family protein